MWMHDGYPSVFCGNFKIKCIKVHWAKTIVDNYFSIEYTFPVIGLKNMEFYSMICYIVIKRFY